MFKLEKFLLSYWRNFSLRNESLPYRVRGSSTKEEEYPKSKKGVEKYSLEKYRKINISPIQHAFNKDPVQEYIFSKYSWI